MDNIYLYAIALLMLIVGFVTVKKIAGCLFKTVLIAILLSVLGVLYYYWKTMTTVG